MRRLHKDQAVSIYWAWQAGNGPTEIKAKLELAGFGNKTASFATIKRYTKWYAENPHELDDPFSPLGIAQFGIPDVALEFLLEMAARYRASDFAPFIQKLPKKDPDKQPSTPYSLGDDGIPEADTDEGQPAVVDAGMTGWPVGFEKPPSYRHAKWWWHVHCAAPSMCMIDVFWFAQHFVVRETLWDVIRETFVTEDLYGFLAYKPWTSRLALTEYHEAVRTGRVPPVVNDDHRYRTVDDFVRLNKWLGSNPAALLGGIGGWAGTLFSQRLAALDIEIEDGLLVTRAFTKPCLRHGYHHFRVLTATFMDKAKGGLFSLP